MVTEGGAAPEGGTTQKRKLGDILDRRESGNHVAGLCWAESSRIAIWKNNKLKNICGAKACHADLARDAMHLAAEPPPARRFPFTGFKDTWPESGFTSHNLGLKASTTIIREE